MSHYCGAHEAGRLPLPCDNQCDGCRLYEEEPSDQEIMEEEMRDSARIAREQTDLAISYKNAMVEANERAESAEQTAERLRGELEQARACIRDAYEESWSADNDGTPRSKLRWEKEHAPAIAASGGVKNEK